MTRVAAIDCGTNSIRLLVADVEGPRRSVAEVLREMEVVRLGQGVDRTGEFAPEALARTLDATRRYARAARELGVERVRFVATSATRDARNRAEFVAGVRDAFGVEPEVISGSEEADLSFVGAVNRVSELRDGPYLVVDLGGGSTEIALGTDAPSSSASLDVGSVRLTERHLASDPPAQAEIDAAAADVRAALDSAPVPFGETVTLVGVAGSITTVTAHAMRLESYDRERLDGAAVPVGIVLAACQDLVAMTRAERAELPYMHPGRVDVIGAGALVWFEVISRVHADVLARGGELRDVLTSEHDILDGIALGLA